jgi:hypothetical protein
MRVNNEREKSEKNFIICSLKQKTWKREENNANVKLI